MAKIKIKLIGSGTEDDPYRVPLPTYRIISVDYKRKYAIVEVPDDECCEIMPDGSIRMLNRLNLNVLRAKYRRVWHLYKAYEKEIEKAIRA